MTFAFVLVVLGAAILRERALTRRIDCLERRCDDLTEASVRQRIHLDGQARLLVDHGQALQDVRAAITQHDGRIGRCMVEDEAGEAVFRREDWGRA